MIDKVLDCVKASSVPRLSRAVLDQLMTVIEINFLTLSQCLVSPGWRLNFPPADAPAIHYNMFGAGKMIVADLPPIDLQPHTLVIVPQHKMFRIEVASETAATSALRSMDGNARAVPPGAVGRFVAGEGEPRVTLICGYFRAAYGTSVNLFAALDSVIVEQFEPDGHVDRQLKAGLAELLAQEVGMGAMTNALFKQVLVALLRRSLRSDDLWVERFAMLSDAQIARAFSDMVARPGAAHSVESLAQTACLSRSAFMARFVTTIGRPPMEVLRDLRMRQAATLLSKSGKGLSMTQVAHSVGYVHPRSFIRAFRKVYGKDPSEFRAEALQHSQRQC